MTINEKPVLLIVDDTPESIDQLRCLEAGKNDFLPNLSDVEAMTEKFMPLATKKIEGLTNRILEEAAS